MIIIFRSRQLEEKLTSFFVLKGSGGLIFYHSQEIVINIFRLFCDCSLQFVCKYTFQQMLYLSFPDV
jgi:hypothetical protein